MSKVTVFWLVLFAATLALLVWKCPYGFGGDDEGFYLTVAHRLTLGDRLFSDEWHLSMLSSFFTYPLVRLYIGLTGGTDGILLFSRYCYIILQALVSVLIYIRMRKYGLAALFASLMFMLYTPLGMMTVSYNTLAIAFLGICAALLGGDTCGRGVLVLSGASFACAVVCSPYLAAAYVFYIITIAVFSVLKKRGIDDTSGLFSPRSFAFFTLGIAVPFVLFMVFFFRHSGIKDVVDNLPGILSDPEHPSQSVVFKFKRYIYCLITAHRFIIVPLGLYVLGTLSLLLDKKRERHAPFYLAFSALMALLCWLLFAPELTETYYNGFILPLALPGFTAYLLLKEKPVRLFIATYVLGLIYSFCVCATSNMGFIVLSMAFVVVNISSSVFIALCLRGMLREKLRCVKPAQVLCSLCFAVLTLMLAAVKVQFCFWDASPSQLGSRIEIGPAKGIVTSEHAKQSYEGICRDLEYYDDKEHREILMYTQSAWTYLILEDYPYASFSAWLSGLYEATEERLAFYYEVNPTKYPYYVCVPKASAFGALQYTREDIMSAAERFGYDFSETDVSYRLEKRQSLSGID